MSRNLIVPGGLAAPVRIAEITASAFPLTGGTPLLGRTLVEADEQPGATPVVVIGFDVWQTRFGGDPNVVGRTVGLGRTTATVVGVMPERFRFPIADDLWVPLRLSTADRERRQGPGLLIFGRLANGVTLDRAQAELTTLGLRAAADFPETHGHLRPQVKPFAKSYLGLSQSDSLFVVSLNLVAVLLLMLIGANVALLVFARAAARESEIIVRNALGASRGRIIVQLFTEALVLSTLAALVGLVAARSGLRWSMSVYEDVFYSSGSWPFWIRPTLSHTTVLYVSLLAVLAAALAGVVPALKITRSLGMRLKQSSAGGGGLRFGGVWTAIVITQVAVTVAFPAVAFFVRREAREDVSHDPGFSHAEYLSVRLELDSETQTGLSEAAARAAFQAQFAASINELERKLESNAAVSGVTFARLLPRMQHPWNQIEVDAGAVEPTDERGHRVGRVPVGIDYFDVLGTTVLSGRNFHTGDLAADARVVIVNQPFVDQVLGGRSALGRRIRYTRSPTLGISTAPKDGPWFEIVGVVRDLGTVSNYGRAGVYHPEARGAHYPTHMIAHVKGQPAAFAHELRAAAAAVDPMLRLNALLPLNKVDNGQPTFLSFWFKLVTVLCALSLLLSLAAIYAVTSFTVARRTPEIGIRVALGADARHVARAIFWR
ncbi:MAG: ABC transporter permease, partial [Longimicrobiales bacterium]